MFFCNASSTTVSLGSLRIPMKPSDVTEYAKYPQINMAIPPSKPARKIRFIKVPPSQNCDTSSLRKSPQQNRAAKQKVERETVPSTVAYGNITKTLQLTPSRFLVLPLQANKVISRSQKPL